MAGPCTRPRSAKRPDCGAAPTGAAGSIRLRPGTGLGRVRDEPDQRRAPGARRHPRRKAGSREDRDKREERREQLPRGEQMPRPATTVARAHGSPPGRGTRREKLSKDAYRRQKAQVDADLTRLGLRKTQLELSMGSPSIAANFVEMRRVASELADVEQALATTEDAWLDLEDRAP